MKHIGLSIVIGSALIACGIALSDGIYYMKVDREGLLVHRLNKWNGEIITCDLLVSGKCKLIYEWTSE
jgi:hypothetical protein